MTKATLRSAASAIALTLLAGGISGCATTATTGAGMDDPAPVAAADQSESARLRALLDQSQKAALERSPVSAFFQGDFTNADKLGDFSPAAFQADRAAAQSELATLRTIDRAALGEADRIAYDTFAYASQRTLAQTQGAVLQTYLALPIDHFRGLHVFYPRLSAPNAVMPFQTMQDYDNNIARHREFARIVDQAIARFRTGAQEGITLPRLSVQMMIEQLDLQLATPAESNPYLAPVRQFPDAFGADERARATAALNASVTGTLFPALKKLRDFLANDYLPIARDSIAATAPAGGQAYYADRIADMTTVSLTADEIHQIGLSEVARINAAIAEAEEERGSRRGETYTTKAELEAAWYQVAAQVDPLLDRLFLHQPRTKLEIKPYEPYREKFNLAASYQAGAADGSRPGVFYFSGYNVAERQLGTSISLYMHEGNPGHHFQSMIAIENEALPDFLRYGGYTAYSEGWGLYAESLGYELGLYDDPVERLKALAGGELLRAVRLVVDTGMHSKGWSRERAIEYMVANGQERDFAESETARYIVMPGQALAYKIGELKIKELRARAQAQLGDRFEVRRFHDEVLNTADIPLPVLEAKIDAWIAAGGT